MRETIQDIVREMRENNGLCVSPLFLYNEDGGVDMTELIERIENASELVAVSAQAEVMCKNGVPMERFNSFVMELSKMREALRRIESVSMDHNSFPKNQTIDYVVRIAKEALELERNA